MEVFGPSIQKQYFPPLCIYTALVQGIQWMSGKWRCWPVPSQRRSRSLTRCRVTKRFPTAPSTSEAGAHLHCSSRAWGGLAMICSLMVVLEGGKDAGIQVQALGTCPGVGSAAQDLLLCCTPDSSAEGSR